MTITVYSKPNCPYCESAKSWLQNHKFDYRVIDVTADPESLAFIKNAGHKTVPQLYVDDRLVVSGGYTGLAALGEEGLRSRLS